jgi:signal transduction histidine kinase
MYEKKSTAFRTCCKLQNRIVIRNLFSNAIKFNPEKGLIIIKSVKTENNIIVSIVDNGPGIDTRHQERMFAITATTPVQSSDIEQGSGLGLVICKDFIEKNDGKIWVESKPGAGSTFSFTLPTA